jgi:hypothetical protein
MSVFGHGRHHQEGVGEHGQLNGQESIDEGSHARIIPELP